jgi:lantibiotic biosynthesis protein
MTAKDHPRQSAKVAAPLYRPLTFAVVRTPMLPVEFYRRLSGTDARDSALCEFLEHERVRLALDSTSPSLVEAVLSKSKSKKDQLRASRKFRRYLIRISTRPTPFGAFAGVGLVPLGEETTLKVDEAGARYARHLDMPWLLEFVHQLESDPKIFRQLRMQANPCAFARGGRVFIRELNSLCEGGRAVQHASLKASRLVMRALAEARTGVTHEHLSQCLSEFPGATQAKVEGLLTELWRQEFLYTDLRPPLTDGDPARYVLDKLESLRDAETYRDRLMEALAGTDTLLRNDRRSTPAAACDSEQPHEKPGTTHIDSILATSGKLNSVVAEEAARAAEFLLSMTAWPSGPPHLQAYRQCFEDRYGVDREVPLLEMIDREYGIGFPAGYDGTKSAPPADAFMKGRLRRDALFDLARAANEDRQLEVELDEDLQSRLRNWVPTPQSATASLEINVFVSARSSRDVDEGRFSLVIGPNIGAMEAGRSLGRFAAPLGSAGIEAYREALGSAEEVKPGRPCVELSYLPRSLRLANILVRPGARRYEIDIGVGAGVASDDSIALDDLVVGVRDGRFYVRSLRLGADLSICSGHMANAQLAPSICRLLAEITLDGTAVLRDFDWGMASATLLFLPRVRVGRTVLSVAKWRVTGALVKKRFRVNDANALRQSLTAWRQEWKVPRYVHLAEADNRLLLDLENEADLEDLRQELSRLTGNQAIMLEEVYPALDDVWVEGNEGRFVAEFVIPVALNRPAKPVQASNPSARRWLNARPEALSRIKPPGSDWLYLKLYSPPSLVDDLLTGPVQEFVRSVRQSDDIDHWFFIRYADPDPHIRLRFHGRPEALTKSLLPEAICWAQQLVKNDLCLRFTIDTYDREIERYGGLATIGSAERLFCIDSESVLTMLQHFSPACPLRRVELAVFSLAFLLGALGCSFEQRLTLFKGITALREESSAAYRERKAILQLPAGPPNDPAIARALTQLLRTLEANAPGISEIGRCFLELDAYERLAVPLPNILRSLAHMHCNRLGLDIATERLAYGLLTRAYDAWNAVSKQRAACVQAV